MRVSRVAHGAAQNGIDGHGEFGMAGEPLKFPVQHFQALLRCADRVHVVDADLQIIAQPPVRRP
jgi:hypothetical protein